VPGLRGTALWARTVDPIPNQFGPDHAGGRKNPVHPPRVALLSRDAGGGGGPDGGCGIVVNSWERAFGGRTPERQPAQVTAFSNQTETGETTAP